MRVLLLSWSDHMGGAARAASRLHQALRASGVESELIVAAKVGHDAHVHAPRTRFQRLAVRVAGRWDRLPLRAYPERRAGLFTPAIARAGTPQRAAAMPRDITHLHWVANGFMRIEDLQKLSGPLVWSLHDLWPLTGGCHYSEGCERYTEQCGRCPVLGSDDDEDLSRQVWLRKRAAWNKPNLTLIASSRWMAGIVRSSSLFRERRIEIVPNCVDTELFRPADRAAARTVFSLPQDRAVVLFGALTASGDRRKGFHLLTPALERLAQRVPRESVCLAVMGLSRPEGPTPLPFDAHYLGVIQDDARLALAYAAADLLVVPSLEDNLPYMVMEAMSCATPCVAFDVSGLPDLIEHGVTGYLARPFEVDDLTRGLESLVTNQQHRTSLGMRSRQAVLDRFAPRVIARRHLDLYEDLLRAAR